MKKCTIGLLLILFPWVLRSQDLMDLLEQETTDTIEYTIATFKSTRILNGHSIERMKEGQLEFRISHRFGLVNSGAYEFWGLDQANMHLSLEYGVWNWLTLGVGRGTYEKAYDGYAKFSLLRQSKGSKNVPVSVSYVSSLAVNSLKWAEEDRNNYFSSRLSYTHQILIARKFTNSFSVQISPTLVHRNLVPTELDPNDLYAVGLGLRYKLTTRFSLNAEYYYVVRPPVKPEGFAYYNPLSLGIDIETGGHVFSLIFTNSQAMIEKGFVGETTGDWLHGDVHFGFNISRVFAIK